MKLGCHVNCSGDEMVLGSVCEALSYNATALMIYTGAPQNTFRKPINQMRIEEARSLLKEKNMDTSDIIVHAPYIVNLANPDLEKREFAIKFLSVEVQRTFQIGSKLMVLHPGCKLDGSLDDAIMFIASGVNKIIENTKEADVVILLETMAGKGSEVGRNFEELARIISLISDKSRVGVCFDTCHVHDAGYDLNDLDNVIKNFDEVVGLKYLKCFHINDSKNVLGSHKDRHSNLDQGYIPLSILKSIVHNDLFMDIPKILETPYINGVAPYKEEIELLMKKD